MRSLDFQNLLLVCSALQIPKDRKCILDRTDQAQGTSAGAPLPLGESLPVATLEANRSKSPIALN